MKALEKTEAYFNPVRLYDASNMAFTFRVTSNATNAGLR